MNKEEIDEFLTIPIKYILEEFCCPICLNTMENVYLTPCGNIEKIFFF